jgi:Na+/melibiose symporter-like transporter
MMKMAESGWRLLGAALAILGIIFLIGGLAALAGNYQQYEAVLFAFGGIFLLIGTGLFLITFFEKNTPEETQPNKKPIAKGT